MFIVKKCVSQITLLTPAQSLEKQKLDFENKKLDFDKQKLEYDMVLNILNNKDIGDIVKNILQEKIVNIIKNIDNKITDIYSENYKTNQNIVKDEIQIHADNTPLLRLKRNNNGRKVQKIDPNNLTKIIKIYDSMVDVVRDPVDIRYNKTGIQYAIKNNKLYKGYRWNFVELGDDPKICNISPTCLDNNASYIRGSILELNSTRTEILNSFESRAIASKQLGIGVVKLREIIANDLKQNDCYYIEFEKCPKELIDKYDKPINKLTILKATQIKQNNPITNQTIIFDSFSDITRKYGITSKTIKKSIKDKTMSNGFLWSYVKLLYYNYFNLILNKIINKHYYFVNNFHYQFL